MYFAEITECKEVFLWITNNVILLCSKAVIIILHNKTLIILQLALMLLFNAKRRVFSNMGWAFRCSVKKAINRVSYPPLCAHFITR